MMKTTKECIDRFGNPYTERTKVESFMQLWDIPDDINKAIPDLPNRIFINTLLVVPLERTLRRLIKKGLHTEIRSYDGCFNIRMMRSGSSISRHAWALALDLNAAWNPLNGKVTWSNAFLEVWRTEGWTCGADWKQPKDGMHFQWDKF